MSSESDADSTDSDDAQLTSNYDGDSDTDDDRDDYSANSDPDPDYDPDSPESVWQDVDPAAEGQAAGDPVERELSDGRPVVVTEPTQADMQRYRDRVRNRQRDIDDSELAERTVMLALEEHYTTPSFEDLTYENYTNSKLGYYNKFVEVIAPELAERTRNL